ncbi:MAG: TfoX/Sxy family DNA transformation protein [Pirellulales bacterium]
MRDVGIETADELRRVGAVEAYRLSNGEGCPRQWRALERLESAVERKHWRALVG